ncbi:hypothetical protein [Azospirillum picis]|uniref:Membrane protein n=1 Tax=Azospirillum picis TaxID=488438 RepID=A0ABU0MNF6_9PROT|nr:hypothetical protein [Azospirillum picis]MBP2301102.1 putative membrane protein [Azospirillum picis]MDQ0534936.1 putative membrane protein [Azospirillum picis]
MADHAGSFLLLTIVAFVVVLLIFGMKYFSAARTARLGLADDEAYRDLAERAVKAQEESAASLSNLARHISTIESRLERVEKVLKEVE